MIGTRNSVILAILVTPPIITKPTKIAIKIPNTIGNSLKKDTS